MKILSNNSGTPLLGVGAGIMFQTTGAPINASTKEIKITQPTDDSSDKPDELSVNNFKVASWGAENDFPQKANAIIRSIGVLAGGLRFLERLTIGQGIFPVKVTGYDEKGNEKLEIVTDPELNQFVKSRMVRKYIEHATRDYFKFGTSFPQLIPSADGRKLVGINTINALRCRLTAANDIGDVSHCIVSSKWPDTISDTKDYSKLTLLNDYDPLTDLNNYKLLGKTKNQSFIQQIKDGWSNNDYYSEPIWFAAWAAGWTDIAKDVPTFLKQAYKNQVTMKWHIQIPYAYWDKKFPIDDFQNKTERDKKIVEFMSEIEKNLCGTENAHKALFTMFEIGPTGKAEEQWLITNLNEKSIDADKLLTSAAANSEILFSLLVNPNVMGAGMPGGTYAGNQGGSNIREAFLVNIANAWLDRQNILDPLETFIRFNGVDPSIELRFRNTILTTLDTGAGTKKVVS
ncbi:MAG: hypothetical protein JXB49_37150 [Bacteroidales bacterium]|nr:hypothetical protein [Bacteroidales bacterium]